MSALPNDLLQDPILGIASPSGERRVSLPEALAALASGELRAYTGQRPHQADYWHVLTVQLAASILARDPECDSTRPPDTPEFWRAGLLELAQGEPRAWQLVVDDATKPAFLQHPLQDRAVLGKPFQPKAHTPDELDVLATAKNHDQKLARMPAADVEAWVYALVCHQTASGYLGAGNYGIVRMNAGRGNRPVVSLVQDPHPSPRWREELVIVCGLRDEVVKTYRYAERGVVLTWLSAWDREGHQYVRGQSPPVLEPWFIEACRAVRLVRDGAGIMAFAASTRARQIGPKEDDSGDVGDPWIPLRADSKKGRKALTVNSTGWTAERLCNLLFEQEEHIQSPLGKPQKDGRPRVLCASALVRGKRKTEGWHEVRLPIPGKVAGRQSPDSERDLLAERAKDWLKVARDVESALSAALIDFAKGGPEKPDFGRKGVKVWITKKIEHFTRRWQAMFFEKLWQTLGDGDEDVAKQQWFATLKALANAELDRALHLLPVPSQRSYRATVRARGVWTGALRKKQPTLFNPRHEGQENVP